MTGRVLVICSVVMLALTAGGFTAGYRAGSASRQPRHPALLTGADWGTFGFREKELYLSGFIAGAGAEQARALAAARGDTADSGAVSSGAIAALHAARQLRYSYAPSVYSAQIDDFYWWENHTDTPIVDVMIAINRQMKGS
ncbi:MAG TPA: hypothetical protein VFS44_07615 [Gemmatimonadaceae bacterium]|nr:hypothetical protein [Gemmatimonadaceae bacterium]